VNDLSNLKAPGWARVVAELSAPAADDKVFLLRLLGVLGQVSGARQAVLFTLSAGRDEAGGEPRPAAVWPFGSDAPDDGGRTPSAERLFDHARAEATPLENAEEVRRAARSAAASRQTMAFGLGADDGLYDPGQAGGCVVAVPVAGGVADGGVGGAPAPQGVVTLFVDGRSRQALQTTLAIVEVLAGYVFGHAAQQALRRTRSASAALDLAARLIASINGADGFKGVSLQFVNDLCRQLGVERVALGWVHGNASARRRGGAAGRATVRLLALSDTENLDRRMAMAQRLEGAMEEALDQEQAILYPPPPSEGPGSDAVLSVGITHAHRELASADAKLRVASLPLRVVTPDGDRIVGVVLIESSGAEVTVAMVELLQATLDLVGPVLAVRQSDDRALPSRAWDRVIKAGAWAVGTRHTVWKMAGVALMVATLLMVFVRTTYRIGAPMELEPLERRTLSVPYDGTLARVAEGAEAGRTVEAGQVLAELDTREMLLSALEAESQILQHEKTADEALREGKLAEATQAGAKAEQSRARRDLLRSQIARSRVVAPIAGTIIAGDLRDKVGAAIKLGEKLFEVADLSEMVVTARVDDRDIALIRLGQTGEVSPKADPSLKVPFTVERIVPLATPQDGRNAFEVRARLTGAPAWFRPGMEGQARFDGAERSLAWIATRRITDQLKVWLWW